MKQENNSIVDDKNKTMQEIFKGYSAYSDKEYKDIWNKATIVVDANILLNFYRFSNETRNELYEILKTLKSRLWIPYQVVYEYFKNKEKVIVEVNDDFDRLLNDSNNCFSSIKNKVMSKSTKKLKCKDALLKELEECEEKIKQIITEDKVHSIDKASEENVEKLIFELFDNSVGPQIIDAEYEKMRDEGARRFEKQIPPGYKDSTKEENGDYYIFYSIMKYAKENKKHIIFITDDVKEDWFIKRFGEIKSGDSRILNEFYRETKRLLLIYTSDGFVNAYQKNIKDSRIIDEKIIDELVANRSNNYELETSSNPRRLRKRILDLIRRLYDYQEIPISLTLRVIKDLQETLIDLNMFDNNVELMLDFFKSNFRENNTNQTMKVLEDLKQYIYSKPIIERRSTNNYLIERIESLDDINNDFNKDIDYILNNLSSLSEKLEMINGIDDKIRCMEKLTQIIKRISRKNYFSKSEILKFDYEIKKIELEINEKIDKETL